MSLSLRTPVSVPMRSEFPVQHRHLKVAVQEGVVVMTITTPYLLSDVVDEGFAQELLVQVADPAFAKAVLDFHGVQAICSAAFGPLLSLRKLLKERGGRLVLCGLSTLVAEAFHIAELTGPDLFETRPDLETALAHLSVELA